MGFFRTVTVPTICPYCSRPYDSRVQFKTGCDYGMDEYTLEDCIPPDDDEGEGGLIWGNTYRGLTGDRCSDCAETGLLTVECDVRVSDAGYLSVSRYRHSVTRPRVRWENRGEGILVGRVEAPQEGEPPTAEPSTSAPVSEDGLPESVPDLFDTMRREYDFSQALPVRGIWAAWTQEEQLAKIAELFIREGIPFRFGEDGMLRFETSEGEHIIARLPEGLHLHWSEDAQWDCATLLEIILKLKTLLAGREG